MNEVIPQEQPPVVAYQPRNESTELAKLFEALAKAQMDMEVAKNDSSNPFFKSKYADLTSVVKASRPFLAKNGLCVLQTILPADDGKLFLHTRLCHASGQWVESKMPLNPLKQDIQTMGSYITYLRRYTYASIVGVVCSDDDDDDGEAVMMHSRATDAQGEKPGNVKISKAQLQVLSQELEGCEEILEGILKGFKIGKLSDLAAKHYTQCITRVREIRRAKEA